MKRTLLEMLLWIVIIASFLLGVFFLGQFVSDHKSCPKYSGETDIRWINPSECQLMISGHDGYYAVTVDDRTFFCRDAEQPAGFPLMVIMYRGEDMRVERAQKSLTIEKR